MLWSPPCITSAAAIKHLQHQNLCPHVYLRRSRLYDRAPLLVEVGLGEPGASNVVNALDD